MFGRTDLLVPAVSAMCLPRFHEGNDIVES